LCPALAGVRGGGGCRPHSVRWGVVKDLCGREQPSDGEESWLSGVLGAVVALEWR
jgi:hypothetical protein